VSVGQSPAFGRDRDPHCDPEEGCVTCGDVAVSMRVVAIDTERELALCADQDGRRETVEIALVQPVGADDELLVHAGTAIVKLGEAVSA
jgi:hydrogenase maturation factor